MKSDFGNFSNLKMAVFNKNVAIEVIFSTYQMSQIYPPISFDEKKWPSKILNRNVKTFQMTTINTTANTNMDPATTAEKADVKKSVSSSRPRTIWEICLNWARNSTLHSKNEVQDNVVYFNHLGNEIIDLIGWTFLPAELLGTKL